LIGTFIQSNSTIVPAISDLLDTAIVRLTLSASERDAALGELVDLVPDDVLTGSRSRILAGLLEREERMTTGVGQGLAIPHLVSSEIRSLTLVIGASSTGVDFNSLDQIPVKLIFVILAPENMRSRYLQVLAGLARLLREEQIVQRALTSSTAEELIALMKKYEALIRLKRELEPGSPSPGT
jgi:mannitol/fructose-specific phosphotransferase system IIA component (Ntr-type)